MSDPTETLQATAPGGDGVPAREESAVRQFSEKEVALIKRTICQGATDEELSMFIQNCKRYGLDPFTGQIHAVKRWDSNAGREVLNVQVGIDGFRLIADRTGKWDGTLGPYWCGEDGEWKDVWLLDDYPAAAKVGVLRADFSEPRWGIARWGAYVATKKSGDPNYMWRKMPAHMLAKCAEALALRSAFPNDLSGLYTDAEMDQAGDNDKRTYDGPNPQEVDAEVVESGKATGAASAPKSKSGKSARGETKKRQNGGAEKASGTDGGSSEPDYQDRLRKIDAWLGSRDVDDLESALKTVQEKVSEWPDEYEKSIRAVTLPYAARDQICTHGPQAEEHIKEWVHEQAADLSEEDRQRALDAVEEEAETMRPNESGEAAEAMQNGETALDSSGNQISEGGAEEGPDREHDSQKAAIQAICPTAARHGSLSHVPEEERISEKQLKRLYAIADEEDWKESWLNRLVKDELGYESKGHLPKGEAYEQVVQALESHEMRFWMSRDPDTPDLFGDPEDDEEVPL